jgi:hypothetical protein
MGCAIQAYAVDEYRIGAFWRSDDDATIAQALASPLGQFRLRDTPAVRDALAEMAKGTSPVGDQPNGAPYLYATEILCAYYGAKAGEELRLSPRGIDAAPELKLFMASSPLFPKVRAPDLPAMCAWGKKQVERRLAARQNWPATLHYERDVYMSWLRNAADRKVALVGFYY